MPNPKTVLWIYTILVLVGGQIGFCKVKSLTSLVTTVVCTAVLGLCVIPGLFHPTFADGLANLVMLALLIVFAPRLSTPKKFVPGGLALALTIPALARRNIRF